MASEVFILPKRLKSLSLCYDRICSRQIESLKRCFYRCSALLDKSIEQENSLDTKINGCHVYKWDQFSKCG